ALGRGPAGGGARPTGRGGASGPAGPRRPVRRAAAKAGANGTTLASPMQGTIVKVAVAEGAQVAEGDLVVVLEAMKMEQPLVAHRAGTVTGLAAGVGSSVSAGSAICEIVG
ncbi:acetyl-CoA carboxylase biotin carboxyl carrier protein subunit, partial [Cellulomonas biazotea]